MMRKNPAIVETLRIALGLAIGLGLMYGVYALISMFSLKVLLGGLLGYILSVGNFFFMAISLMNLADQGENPRGGLKMQGGFLFRMLIMGGLIVLGVKLGYCDAIASVIPVLLVRPVITIEQFILGNSGGNKKSEIKDDELNGAEYENTEDSEYADKKENED